jgi:hypothetical protein
MEIGGAVWIARGEQADLGVIPGGAQRREGDPDFADSPERAQSLGSLSGPLRGPPGMTRWDLSRPLLQGSAVEAQRSQLQEHRGYLDDAVHGNVDTLRERHDRLDFAGAQSPHYRGRDLF